MVSLSALLSRRYRFTVYTYFNRGLQSQSELQQDMQALKFSFQEKKLELLTLPVPKIENPHQVLIKVAYSGVCGTDLHIISGQFPCNKNRPFTLGHEFCGVAVDVGSSVTHIKEGDEVVVDPNSGCGFCKYCHLGNPHLCSMGGVNNTIGIHRDGGWAQYALIPDAQVHKLPNEIDLKRAVLTEPVSCLSHTWDLISPITMGHQILILGAGIIGNLSAAILHLQGHRLVTISEPSNSRRRLLQNLNTSFDCITPETLKERQESCPDYLFDLIIDCSGSAPAIEHAFTILQMGGTLCVFGVTPPECMINISPFQIVLKETKIIGVNVNPFSFPKSLAFLESMGDRYLKFEDLGIQLFSLNNYEKAIEALKEGSIAKAVFKL